MVPSLKEVKRKLKIINKLLKYARRYGNAKIIEEIEGIKTQYNKYLVYYINIKKS